jgi:hypothetical protein
VIDATSPKTSFLPRFYRNGMAVLRRAFSGSLFAVCVGVLVVSNGISLWRLNQLRNIEAEHPPGVSIDGLRATAASILDPTQKVDGKAPASAILFVFTLHDCPAAVEELAYLNRLHRDRPDIAIRAVMSKASAAEARQTQENFQLSFPVLADPDSGLLRQLQPPRTPWKAVIALPSYRLLAEDGPSITPSEKEAFFQRIRIFHVLN